MAWRVLSASLGGRLCVSFCAIGGWGDWLRCWVAARQCCRLLWVASDVFPSWDLPLGSVVVSSPFLAERLGLGLVDGGSPALCVVVPRARVCVWWSLICPVACACFRVSCVSAVSVLVLVWILCGCIGVPFACAGARACVCVVCQWRGLWVLVPASPSWGLQLVLAGLSPVLAKGPRCSSLPSLARVCCWCLWVVPRQSWLRVLDAVPHHSCLGSAACVGGWHLAHPG